MAILDSGDRREFQSGAVRDMSENKGRCDLLPLGVISDYIASLPKDIAIQIRTDYSYTQIISAVFRRVHRFIYSGKLECMYDAITEMLLFQKLDPFTMILELSKHYEEGAKKYAERNWEKGIPLHSYIDSAIRHLLKFIRGDVDEPHDRAFYWNMFGAIFTYEYLPDYNDLPCNHKDASTVSKYLNLHDTQIVTTSDADTYLVHLAEMGLNTMTDPTSETANTSESVF